jgi:carboxylesterase
MSTPLPASTASAETLFANAFSDPKHDPFDLAGEAGSAVLIHGFPGTPFEMRGVGEALHAEGWRAKAVLLPGFGSDIATLPQRRVGDWQAAVKTAFEQVRRDNPHKPAILVGHSMGGSLAISLTAALNADALIAVSPFWKLNSALWAAVPVLRHVIRSFKPFKLTRIDFENPQAVFGIQEFIPDANLRDPAVQNAILEFSIPTSMITELRRVGLMAGETAHAIHCPALVLQGTRDPLVLPENTRVLASRFGRQPHLITVDGEHDLTRDHCPSWQQVKTHIVTFANTIANGHA